MNAADVPLIIATLVSITTLVFNIIFNRTKNKIDTSLANNTIQGSVTDNLFTLVNTYQAQVRLQEERYQAQLKLCADDLDTCNDKLDERALQFVQNDDKVSGLQATVIKLMETSSLDRIELVNIKHKLSDCENKLPK